MKNYSDLIKKYPELFYQEENSQEPIALFGVECDIGWYDIIEKACNAIYRRYKSAKTTVEYWQKTLSDGENFLVRARKFEEGKTDEEIIKDRKDYLNNMISELEVMKSQLPKIVQLKEKFGTLRFYLEGGTESNYDIASYAEDMSEVTCEKCGNVGRTYTMGWHKTLCEKHAIERYGEEKVKLLSVKEE